MSLKPIAATVMALAALLGAPAMARADMTLTSADVENGRPLKVAQVFKGFGCDGGNQSPDLSWTGAPEGTRSFAVTIYDPDEPSGSGWYHWVAFDIPPDVTNLPTGASLSKMPKGAIEGRTDYGGPGFGGACPPAGDKPHRYIITVYAMKVDRLGLDANSSGAMVGFLAHYNALAKASITATYGR